MKTVILTEGTRNTGYGHLTRCLALHHAFEEKGINPIYVANCDEKGKEILSLVHLHCLDWLAEQERLYDIVDGADLLMIDSYLAARDVYSELSSRVAKAAYIDDYRRIEYPKGIIINGTIDSEYFEYQRNPQQELLLGVRYVPLRREFWEVPERETRETVREVLITLGGLENTVSSFAVLDIMLREFGDMNYVLVLVGGFDRDSAKRYSKHTNIEFLQLQSGAEMLNLMLRCDAAISAGGQSLYELARVGTPTVAVGLVHNQENNLRGWLKNGFLLDALRIHDRNIDRAIVSSFNKTTSKSHRDKIIGTIPHLVDGQGARRIVDYLMCG